MSETSEKPSTSLPAERRSFRPSLWPLYRQICGRSDWPILIGPWRGEVGFEALYWLPFIAQLKHDFGIPSERLIPISRGGASIWYDTPKGVELYQMRTPQDVRIANKLQHQTTGMLKQNAWTPFDRQVIRDVADTLKLRRYHVLHPSWMYQTLRTFWEAQTGLQWLQSRVRMEPLPTMNVEGLTLPEKFVAVRFYFRATFKATEIAREFAKQTIRQLAKDTPVIILNNRDHLDDHLDYVPKDEPNVQILSDLVPMEPANNLAVQSAVLQRAMGFVGTYGGFAQLALRMGKPVVSVYDDWQGTAMPHRHLSDALALLLGVPFHVLKLNDLPLMQRVLPRVLTQ